MNPENALIVVVLYEIDIENSITLLQLFRLKLTSSKFPEILIYDNSKQPRLKDRDHDKITYYYHNIENAGVAGAYNYALSLSKACQKDWLILFDQDTQISDKYFEELQKNVLTYPEHNLFCPTVISYNKIISPALYFAEKTFKLKSIEAGIKRAKNYTVINSGLLVRVSELDALGGYDSDLPLDFSDHLFFHNYKKRNHSFVLINCSVKHSLSSYSDVKFDVVLKRFKLYRRSSIIYARKVGSPYPVVWLAMRALKLSIKFAKIDFFKSLFLEK